MSWPDGVRYLRPPQSLVVSLILSLVSTLVLSRTRGVLSHRSSFDTQVSSISTEELVLPRHARCVLSRLRCNGHSLLLGSCLFRIGRIENPSCSACGHSSQDISHLICTVQLRTLCATHSLATLSLYDLWSKPGGVSRHLGLHGIPPCPHPSEGGSGNQQQQHNIFFLPKTNHTATITIFAFREKSYCDETIFPFQTQII